MFGLQEKSGWLSSKSDLDYFMQKYELGFAFCSTQLSNYTSPNSHLQKVLPCKHACHTWDLQLGTPYEPALSTR